MKKQSSTNDLTAKAEGSTRPSPQDDAEEQSRVSLRLSAATPRRHIAAMRRGEQKPSPSEQRILAALRNADGDGRHQRIDDIFRNLVRAGEKVSHSTIYRTLTRMEEKGQVTRHQFLNGASLYELSSLDRHCHFFETDSSKISDFKSDELERLMEDIADQHDTELLDYKIVLFVRPKASITANKKNQNQE